MMPARNRPVILLTAFGPFPSVPDNASARMLPNLARAAASAFPGHVIKSEVLVTEWRAGTARAVELLEGSRPAVAIHFGVSGRATGFTLESRAVNDLTATADACGEVPDALCLVSDGPAVMASNLPVALIASRLRMRGLPVTISRDAGRYLCNATLFHSLVCARRADWRLRNGFVHLPVEIGERRRIGNSQLTMPDAIGGGLEIIAASLGLLPPTLQTTYLPRRTTTLPGAVNYS